MNLKRLAGFTLSAAIVGVFVSAVLSVPVFAKDKLPEVDSDGLYLVPKTKVMAAYIKPGTDLSKYSKVKLLACYVDFVKGWERDYNL